MVCVWVSHAIPALKPRGLRSVSPARISGRGPPFGVTGSMAKEPLKPSSKVGIEMGGKLGHKSILGIYNLLMRIICLYMWWFFKIFFIFTSIWGNDPI